MFCKVDIPDYNKLRVGEIKAICKIRKQPRCYNKNVLIRSLVRHDLEILASAYEQKRQEILNSGEDKDGMQQNRLNRSYEMEKLLAHIIMFDADIKTQETIIMQNKDIHGMLPNHPNFLDHIRDKAAERRDLAMADKAKLAEKRKELRKVDLTRRAEAQLALNHSDSQENAADSHTSEKGMMEA